MGASTKELQPLDVAWIKKSLELQRSALARARQKEMPGSEIDVLRGREIDQLVDLIRRLG